MLSEYLDHGAGCTFSECKWYVILNMFQNDGNEYIYCN